MRIRDVPGDGDCLLRAEAMNDGRENLEQGVVDRRRREIVDQEYNDAISSIDVNAPDRDARLNTQKRMEQRHENGAAPGPCLTATM